MTTDAHTETKPVAAAKPGRTPHRPDATDKAAREILAAERKAMQAKTERLRAARLAQVAVAVVPEVKAAPKAAAKPAAKSVAKAPAKRAAAKRA